MERRKNMVKEKQDYLHIVLKDFAREVIRGAKQNLQKRNASGKLSRSLKSDVKVNPKSFELDFEMEGYGQSPK